MMDVTGKKVMVNQQKLAAAFLLMRKAGLFARRSYACCQSCGCYQIVQEVEQLPSFDQQDAIRGAVFYHKQDAEKMRLGQDLYLAFFGHLELSAPGGKRTVGGDALVVGGIVRRALESAGLKVEWNGTDGERTKCSRSRWKRRGSAYEPPPHLARLYRRDRASWVRGPVCLSGARDHRNFEMSL